MAGLSTLAALPSVINQGASLLFAVGLSDFPASDWSVAYTFRQKAGAFTLTATASGADHFVSIAPETTAVYPPGVYYGEGRATNSGTGQVSLFWTGSLEVKPDLTQAPDGYDTRSYARKILDSLKELAVTRASQDVTAYTVAGQSFSHASSNELQQRIAYWQEVVDAEEGKSNRVVVRFQ